MIRRWLFALLVLAKVDSVSAEPSAYACVVEQSAGLHYDSKTTTWAPKAFKPGKEFVLRRLTEDDSKIAEYRTLLNRDPKANWAFFDGKMLLATCVENDFTFGSLLCRSGLADANFDKDSRRFELVYRGAYTSQGYWQQLKRGDSKQYESLLASGRGGDAERPDDLSIQIGKCSPDR
ncbi:hypothetical protein [Burkholderia cepacia]|uniref:hypothetical protein n=1 Tax=Burkholderia cepacia TaxID=292 RepID=UPI00158F0249|nr:hypothetical protein [Burkholderia cepacia]